MARWMGSLSRRSRERCEDTRVASLGILGVLTVALSMAAPAVEAQSLRARCQLGDRVIYAGQPTVYDVLVRGAEEVEILEEPSVAGLVFEQLGAGRRNSVFQNINGVVSSYSDFGLQWTVTADAAGVYEIPMPKLRASAGQDVIGHSVTLTVRDESEQDLASVDLDVSANHVVLGQMVGLTVDVYLKHLPAPAPRSDPLAFHDEGRVFRERGERPQQLVAPQITLPWVPVPPFGRREYSVEDWARDVLTQGKGLSLSAGRGVARGRFAGEVADVERRDARGEMVKYRRYRFYVELRADTLGTFEIPRAVLEGYLTEKSGAQFAPSRIYTRSPSITILVEEAPTEGRPADYRGAVGTFELEASRPTPNEVAVGEPVYLTLVVKGRGFLDGVELDLAPHLGSDWRAEVPKVTDSLPPGTPRPQGFPDRPGNWRQFDYKLRPLQEGVTAVPALGFSFFDPEQHRYRTVYTEPFPITVHAAGTAIGDAGVMNATGGGGRAASTELVAAGLSPNEDDLNLLGNQRARPWPYLVFLVGLVPAWFVFRTTVHRRRTLRADPAIVRRRRAKGRAQARLREARGQAALSPRRSVELAVGALAGYVADLEDRPEDAVTSGEVLQWARGIGTDDEVLSRLNALFTSGEAVAFGGELVEGADVDHLLAAADRVVDRIRGRGRAGAATALIGLLSVAGSLDAQDIDRFREAQAAFNAGRFTEAAAGFESMLSDSYENGYVLYNLGNAWLNAGELGRAIVAYRRAEAYLPYDANLRRNLDAALARRRQSLSPDPSPGVLDTILFWRRGLRFSTQAWIALLCGVLAFGLATVRLLVGPSVPFMRGGAWLGVVLALLFTTSAAVTHADLRSGDHGAIVVDDTRLLQWPAEDADPSFEDSVHDGAELRVLSRREDWLKVRVADRYEGWIPASRAVTW